MRRSCRNETTIDTDVLACDGHHLVFGFHCQQAPFTHASSMALAIEPGRGISGRCSRSNQPDSITSSPSGRSSPEAYSALKPIMMFDGNGHVCEPNVADVLHLDGRLLADFAADRIL